MNLRREPTYLSSDVWKACRLIARWRSTRLDDQGLPHQTSTDEIAVELLRQTLKEHYPFLLEHQRQVTKMEDELIKTLGEKLT